MSRTAGLNSLVQVDFMVADLFYGNLHNFNKNIAEKKKCDVV